MHDHRSTSRPYRHLRLHEGGLDLPAGVPLASPSEHAQVAFLLLSTIRNHAPLILWRPHCARWGLALIAAPEPMAVIALDGCLEFMREHHLRPFPRRFRYATLAQLLLGSVSIREVEGRSLVRCSMPPAPHGRCCIVIEGRDLPWLHSDLAVEPCSEAEISAQSRADAAAEAEAAAADGGCAD